MGVWHEVGNVASLVLCTQARHEGDFICLIVCSVCLLFIYFSSLLALLALLITQQMNLLSNLLLCLSISCWHSALLSACQCVHLLVCLYVQCLSDCRTSFLLDIMSVYLFTCYFTLLMLDILNGSLSFHLSLFISNTVFLSSSSFCVCISVWLSVFVRVCL